MMQDPMADLGADPTAQGASPDNVKHGKQVLDPVAMQMNMQRIDRIRSVMGIVSGCFVGIVGLTGLQGFACFIALHIFTCLMIWAWKMNFDLASYTRQSWFGYLSASIQPTALSFLLFWTLFYGLVYLY